MKCPECGDEQEDFDGFGFLFCEACRYCTHASIDGGICGFCGVDITTGVPPDSEEDE